MTTLIHRLGFRLILWVLLLCGMVACAAVWVRSIQFAHSRMAQLVEQQQAQAHTQAVLASANLNQRLAQARGIAATMAQGPAFQNALDRFGPHVQPSPLSRQERSELWQADPVLQPLSERMQYIVDKFDLHSMWITNAAGDTVAAGHAQGTSSFVGTNYADRDYFKATRLGRDGQQFAVGRVTNMNALYISSPVLVKDQFVGMVGAALAMPKLKPALGQLNAVVTDDLGVIVLAQNPALLMQTMPGATVGNLSAEAQDLRYKRTHFDAVDLRPAQGPQPLYPWHYLGQPHAMGTHPTSDGALHAYVLLDLGESLARIEHDQLWWFGVVSVLVLATTALAIGAAYYVTTMQQQQAALQALNHELDRQANTDALTGCANRRHFMVVLEQEISRSSRYGEDFCVLSADLDHFKRVNDTHGHAAGDEVLRHFVTTIGHNLRETDLLGRLGGEEFSILLPHTSVDGGVMMAERIRCSVEGSAALFGTTRIAVTVSIGGIAVQAGAALGVDAVLARADEALYAAKQGGRNRVEWVPQWSAHAAPGS